MTITHNQWRTQEVSEGGQRFVNFVAVVYGNVAKICSNVSVIEYVPSCLAVLGVTLFQLKIQPKYTLKSERFFCFF